jgi:hypothetical protein
MHSGIFRTLGDVLGFYEDTRGGLAQNPNVSREEFDPLVRELRDLDAADVGLIEFLRALSDDSFDRTIPEAYRSACPSAEEFNRAEWLTSRTNVSIDRIATGFRQIGVIFPAFDNGDLYYLCRAGFALSIVAVSVLRTG